MSSNFLLVFYYFYIRTSLLLLLWGYFPYCFLPRAHPYPEVWIRIPPITCKLTTSTDLQISAILHVTGTYSRAARGDLGAHVVSSSYGPECVGSHPQQSKTIIL